MRKLYKRMFLVGVTQKFEEHYLKQTNEMPGKSLPSKSVIATKWKGPG